MCVAPLAFLGQLGSLQVEFCVLPVIAVMQVCKVFFSGRVLSIDQ